MKIKEGEKLPDSNVFVLNNNSPEQVSINQLIGKDKIIIFGIPGAFTPTCSAKHLPSFINSMETIKNKNVKKVICISVNDPFVMEAWGKSSNATGKIIMVGDSKGEFTKNIGAEVDLGTRGLNIRSVRYAMLVEAGLVKKLAEEEVAGKCEITAAENFVREI